MNVEVVVEFQASVFNGDYNNLTNKPTLLKGDKGDKGDTGDKGDKGDTGERGLQGIQGIQGERGLQGIQGIQGERGRSIRGYYNLLTISGAYEYYHRFCA